jgi:hypothetical protein
MIGSADARDLGAGGSGAGAGRQAAHARATQEIAAREIRNLALIPVTSAWVCVMISLQRDSTRLATPATTTGEDFRVMSD